MELASWVPMLESSPSGWLVLAFALGLVHSLDADHVMAMSVFSTRASGVRDGARAGLRWAVGHGAILLAAGAALLLLGRALPEGLSAWADRGVGLLMIGLGGYVFFELVRRRSHLHFHAHDELAPHAHWHSHDAGPLHPGAGIRDHSHDHEPGDPAHRHEHGAMMVGALHGLAGSAPILAVLPAAARSPWLGLAYLVLFALGVALAMVVVSGMLGHLTAKLSQRRHATGLSALRAFSATGSIALGAWLAWVA